VTKVVKETKNKERDFYASDCTDPYFIVFVDEYNASPAAANAAKLHTPMRATRMPPTSRTWTNFQPKGTGMQWTQTRYHPTFTEGLPTCLRRLNPALQVAACTERRLKADMGRGTAPIIYFI
jgi:hypothetical protein